MAAIAAMWWVAAAIPAPVQGTRVIVPLTLTYGQQPPKQLIQWGDLQSILAFWPADGEPRLTPQGRRDIVPLTLRYGQQPPLRRPSDTIFVIPWQVDWSAQSEADNASWNIPVVSQLPAFRRDSVAQVFLDWLAQRAFISTAWVAPPVVSQPSPFRRDPLSPTWFEPGRVQWRRYTLVDEPIPSVVPGQAPKVVLWPAFDSVAQTMADNAAWNFVPPVVSQPSPMRRDLVPQVYLMDRQIGLSPIAAVVSGSVLLGGSPVASVMTPVGIWSALDWVVQRAGLSTAWVVPPVVSQPPPFRRDPVIQVFLDWRTQLANPIAPLTLVYGQRPPCFSLAPIANVLALWPPANWASQSGARIVALSLPSGEAPPRWSIVPLMLVRGLWIADVWNVQHSGPVAAWQPIVVFFAHPLQLEDRSGFLYALLDQSTKRYLVVVQSDIRVGMEEHSEVRDAVDDQAKPKIGTKDQSS